MSKVLVTESYLSAIASAIRSKAGTQQTFTPAQMASAITNIPSGGGSVAGSFTTGAGGVETVNIPYTGNGYIIALSIVIDGGFSNAPYRQYNSIVYMLTKINSDTTPNYSSGASTTAIADSLYRTASSSQDRTSIYGVKYKSAGTPDEGKTVSGILYITSKNTLAIYTSANTGSSHRGFYPNQKYNYWITYSE